ncbi:hypothetical protein [Dyadobacter psychrotolerans]|uniref:Uncharacterized protein n=1 Tax=Dyadobacter psychrotolerans TaxID=2541721 RepID=A0A4V2Z4R4_9BACT|nr:hypothetical protein [Dyadobacter psychrotolerans]TDE17688.1 hypothetical protein E0F88_07300 [Dyadobacter psychrotolerans]
MASKRRIRKKVCGKKKAYETMQQALATRHHIGLKKELAVYKCPVCQKWHLGHKVKSQPIPHFNAKGRHTGRCRVFDDNFRQQLQDKYRVQEVEVTVVLKPIPFWMKVKRLFYKYF